MNNAILQINSITKRYEGNGRIVQALDGVSFSIHQGEIFSLLGVNGAGKTTLSSILATLHPPTSGDVLYNGVSIYNDIDSYRMDLGFCPQHQNLDQFLTVEENLYFAGRYFLLPKDLLAERVTYLLEHFCLQQYANFAINELSGGNKQRVLIARALIHNPKIIIFDEPTVGLDPDIRRALWQQIKSLKKMGITIILTTHYLDEAEQLSDRVCFLHKGKVILIDSVQALKTQRNKEHLEDIFIDLIQEQKE
ncbi:MAG TPA: ABC transporter ATP-binding protein [Candidatus Babeliales bacterium]|jgi:ABC-2 type transport system ATP-binding protein|nr:ABC transporter ATP-binding protein [Candidatus Babeliales bacterium]